MEDSDDFYRLLIRMAVEDQISMKALGNPQRSQRRGISFNRRSDIGVISYALEGRP